MADLLCSFLGGTQNDSSSYSEGGSKFDIYACIHSEHPQSSGFIGNASDQGDTTECYAATRCQIDM